MANLDSLKWALTQKVATAAPSSKQPLSDKQYQDGFNSFMQGSGWANYQDFIIPQMSMVLTPIFDSRVYISVLEIGPGPKSVLGYLPGHMRLKIKKYTAFEPNLLFATMMEKWLRPDLPMESPFPGLEGFPIIHQEPFSMHEGRKTHTASTTGGPDEKYDVILFCHSMYGLNPKPKFIERALEMLVKQPEGMVLVFHRDGNPNFDELVCHQTTSFPTGEICVLNDDSTLDGFASFIVGFKFQDREVDEATRREWRQVCRTLGRRTEAQPNYLFFSSPDLMMAFTKHSTALSELKTKVPFLERPMPVKNWEARLHRPALIARPTDIQQIQHCIQWAIKHKTGLTVVGGGHSAHCLRPNIAAIDMAAFNKIHLYQAGDEKKGSSPDHIPLVMAEAGCKAGDIIRKTMEAGLTVPLGARPSVGAGLWLQGGIGHLSRLYGLACDAIVGAVVISVKSSQVFCIGHVPTQHWPTGAVRPKNEMDLLWALRGAGTNIGIVVSVAFKVFAAPAYLVRKWIVPSTDSHDAQLMISNFERFAKKLPQNCSADAYLYCEAGEMRLGITMFETSTPSYDSQPLQPTPIPPDTFLGPADSLEYMDGVEVFDAEMYVSEIHGGHGGSKTLSFKRCLFLKCIGQKATEILMKAIRTRPSPLCYFHLLHGGGAVRNIAISDTAFGCRDWSYACVVTGVWLRDLDGTTIAQDVVQWVYNVVNSLLPLSCGTYSADLGPDPRDMSLSVKAFGPNRQRLAKLKHVVDPFNVLKYTCPLPRAMAAQKLIILVTGESCAGKDYCANVWVSVFMRSTHKQLTARAVSISDVTKREYSEATGADLKRLLSDRAYKEQHRSALTNFFQRQVQQQYQLPEQHFLDVVHHATDVDVLLITGMRDEAPVATFSHLVPASRLLEVHVRASGKTRGVRRTGTEIGYNACDKNTKDSNHGLADLNHRPEFIFDNDTDGRKVADSFAQKYLFPFLHEDLQRLSSMVNLVSEFPRPTIEFRHVLNICQQPGGLHLCTSLLQSHFTGNWAGVDMIVCCEAGGFVYASALALRVGVPLALIREAGKLPPPTISLPRSASHISAYDTSKSKNIEIGLDIIPRGASVVVVDDVLATGNTLSTVLQLLSEANVITDDIKVMVVAEFPLHRGRELFRQRGFGRVHIQSLLVFDGA
ncbi:hypothetical protein LOZ53_004914 [Ophidiomyces ophidiicola]|nr:hypothetical protein LOZ55_001098 [Ophidiomyces ophidiicola]KAI1985778.1 hypothetical protein LOZ53_004914 [Ophidiomyces ophidiicola]KAI1995551.1 hypothetical protein LOZ51_003377 [Ophidiomyces ophidiicola]KAI1996110.1 hypothetical protein LOZ54_000406 [Ophidiomyces ophidiicola]